MPNRRASTTSKNLRGKTRANPVKAPAEPLTPIETPSITTAGIGPLVTKFAESLRPKLIAQGTYNPIDEQLFLMLCRQMAIAEIGFRQLESDAIFRFDENHVLRRHPAVQVVRDAMVQVNNLAKQFGLGHLNREALTLSTGDEETDLERELFGGGNE